MPIFLSTTFASAERTELSKVLELLKDLDFDGLELGSTHLRTPGLADLIEAKCDCPLVTHNFFPPPEDTNFVVNIASVDDVQWEASIKYAQSCIQFAAKIGATTYTIHPGFLCNLKEQEPTAGGYDFLFDRDRADRSEAFDRMIKALRFLVQEAVRNKVSLAVETEGSLTAGDVLLMTSLQEYERLFEEIPTDLHLNLNLAHSRFASQTHHFELEQFIYEYYDRISLIELSDNDGRADQHRPIAPNSFIFNYLRQLPQVPLVLEFRNCSVEALRSSMALIRAHSIGEL